MRLASTRGSLLRQNRPFRWLWCSRTMSFIGGSTGMVGILLHLADTNEAVAAVALLMLCGDFVPALLAPFIGALADRVELKRLMLACEIGQAAATVVLAVWLPALPVFLALFTLRAVLGQIFQPASRTAVPALVPDADLESANAHLGFGEHGLSVLGPLLAALLVPFIGVRGLLLFDAATFIVSALLLTGLPAMTARPLGFEQEGSFLRHAADGLRFLWGAAGTRLVVFSFVTCVAFTGVDDLALVFLATGPLGSGDAGVGVIYAGSAAGLLVGFALVNRWGALLAAPALLVAGYALGSLGNLLTGLAWSVAAAVTLQAIRGLGIAATDVAAATLIQRGVSREMQGRTFANFYGAIGLAAGASYILGGFLVGAAGPRLTFIVAGAGGLAVAAYTAARLRSREHAA